MSVAAGAKPTEPAFELLRFRAVPAGMDVAVLELEGRFAAPTQRRLGRPRLLVQADDRQVEAAAVSGREAFAGPDAAVWSAVYALPLAAVDGAFTLAVGRRLLLDLPEPYVETTEGAPAAHHVRLAREANALRRRADEADAELAAASAERDRLAGELASARDEAERLRGELAAAEEAKRATEQRTEAEREQASEAAAQARRELEAEQVRTREAAAQGRRDVEAERQKAREAAAQAARELEEERERARKAAEEAAGELESERAAAGRAVDRVRREADSRAHRVQEEHSHRLEGAHREAQEAMAAAREESLHRLEEAVAAQRAKTLAARHSLRVARAELEAIHREHPGIGARQAQRDEPAREAAQDEPRESRDPAATTAEHAVEPDPDDLEPKTEEVAGAPSGAADAPTRATTLGPAAEGRAAATQTVRVLNPRARRPRRDLATEAREANDSVPMPGAAEVGAQYISRATGRRDLAARVAEDPVRALAVAALAVFVLALLVILLGISPF